jgi:uncharacterized protein
MHARARDWLEETLSGEASVALPWIVVLGFLRLTTSGRVFPSPLEPEAALRIVDGWLERPNVTALSAGRRHWRVLRTLIEEAGTAGNLTSDAHLAALAIEHGAELCSTDADFARFRGLRWRNPLQD